MTTAPTPTPEPQPTPPAPEPEPPAPSPPDRMFSQADLDRIVQDRLARAKKEPPPDYEDLKAKAAKLDELEQANATELEKAQKRAEEAERKANEFVAEMKETRLRAAVIAEAAKPERRVVDPEAVVALLDRSELELDDSGVPTNIAQAMDSLLEKRPYLVATDGGTRGHADQGARGGGRHQLTRADVQKMSPEEMAQAEAEGRLAHLLGGAT